MGLSHQIQRSRDREKAKALAPKKPTTRRDVPKTLISIRLDTDVLERFKATGPGWQSRINELLKASKP